MDSHFVYKDIARECSQFKLVVFFYYCVTTGENYIIYKFIEKHFLVINFSFSNFNIWIKLMYLVVRKGQKPSYVVKLSL